MMESYYDWPELLKRAIDEQLVAPVPIFDWELAMTKDAREYFQKFNQKYYNNELPEVDIVMDPFEVGKRLGCFMKSGYGNFGYSGVRPAIVICPLVINKNDDARVDAIVLHEMAHLYCYIHGITDMVKEDDGKYRHTMEFAQVCMEHGLSYRQCQTNSQYTILIEDDERQLEK